MRWRDFVLLGVAKGKGWATELARVRRLLPRMAAAKLVFVRAEQEVNNENNTDL